MIYGMEWWHDALAQRMMALSQAIGCLVGVWPMTHEKDDVNPLTGLLLGKGLFKSSQACGGGRPRRQWYEGSIYVHLVYILQVR